MPSHARWRHRIAYLVVALFLFFALFPFLWMGITSLKTNRELYDLRATPLLIRQGATTEHYDLLLQRTPFLVWFRNSTFVAGLSTILSAAISIPAAYALARLRFRASGIFGLGIFLGYLVPPTLLFIPLSRVVALLDLTDSLWALVATYPTFTVPFCTWLLMGYLRGVPRELEESAMVDGATRFQTLYRIVLPVAIPGILTVVMFSFTLAWGHFVYPLAFINQTTQKVLTVGLATELIRGDVFFWGALMAGALLASLPIVLVYAFFTRYFIAGLTAGATKY
jgi:multiple sugar transport system permease protein